MKLNDLIIDVTNDKYISGNLFNIAEIHKTIVDNLSQIEITGFGESPMALSLFSETENLIQNCQEIIRSNENEIEKYFYTLDMFPDQNNEVDYTLLTNHLCVAKMLFAYYLMLNQYCSNLTFRLKKTHKHLQW